MTREGLQKLFELNKLPCEEAVEWASEQEDQSVEGLLAACQNHEWRGFVSRNSRSIVILEQLAGDENWWVRSGVARNSNTPTAILKRLAKDGDEWVRGWVASNPQYPHGHPQEAGER